jgi:cytochrome b involved in lipid metabolism
MNDKNSDIFIKMGCLRDFNTEKEVADYMHKTGRKYVIFEGSVYDVTEYIGAHPGGTDKIEPLLGQSIDKAYTEAGHTRGAR